MPTYVHRVISPNGERQSGQVQAPARAQALQQLTQTGDVVLELTEVADKPKNAWMSAWQRVDIDTLVTFYKQFAFLLRSGLPLFSCLELVIKQTTHKQLARVLQAVRNDIINGKSLSDAMRCHPQVFHELQVSMILVGEGAGKLEDAFETIVEVVEAKRALRKRISKIVTYMLMMLCLMASVFVGLLTYVFPKFAKIFAKTGVRLPLTTRTLIGISQFIQGHQVELMLGVLLLLATLLAFSKSNSGRRVLDYIKLKLPFVRDFTAAAALADFTHTLAALLKVGVSMVHALEIARDVTPNVVIRPMLTQVIHDVREGSRFADALARFDLFPTLLVQLTVAGENSGQLDAMMQNIHHHFKQRAEEAIARFTSLVEPLVLLVLGCLVLVMALSIFLPMFNLASTVRH